MARLGSDTWRDGARCRLTTASIRTDYAFTAGGLQVPANSNELDALAQAKKWTDLQVALSRPPDFETFSKGLNWLHIKVDSGGGLAIVLLFANHLWDAGSTLNVNDPLKDMRASAGVMALYAYELIVIDGARCEDRTAPSNRMTQLFGSPGKFMTILAFLKSKPPEPKPKYVDVAIAVENRTAARRKEDDVICRGGLDEIRAGLEGGTQKEVPSTAGHVGKTIEVAPAAEWVPKFVGSEIYIPMQEKARADMRERLLKLIE